jgi:hypothetical protein
MRVSGPLSNNRVRLAYAAAVAADLAQLLLGPFGLTLADEVLDVAAMAVISWLIGFHPLLLPTFVLELFPVVDLLPTWTGCVGLVIALRRRREAKSTTWPRGPVIDV